MICDMEGCTKKPKPHNVVMRCSRCKGIFCDAHRTSVSHNCEVTAEERKKQKLDFERMRCVSKKVEVI